MKKFKKYLLENSNKKPQSVNFEVLRVAAPLWYEDPHLFGLKDADPAHIGIQGRVINIDGSRGPEVIAPVHAFHGIDPATMTSHADEMIRRKTISKNNILHQTWNDQGGDSPSTLKVDPSHLESLESYSKRTQNPDEIR